MYIVVDEVIMGVVYGREVENESRKFNCTRDGLGLRPTL